MRVFYMVYTAVYNGLTLVAIKLSAVPGAGATFT